MWESWKQATNNETWYWVRWNQPDANGRYLFCVHFEGANAADMAQKVAKNMNEQQVRPEQYHVYAPSKYRTEKSR